MHRRRLSRWRLLFGSFLLTGLFVLGQNALAGPADQRGELQALFKTSGQAPYLNGEILISRHGRTEAHYAGGFADFTKKTPIRSNSVFQLASLAKVFTSTAVLQLVEKGQLHLDDKVQKTLTAFPFPSVTVRHLLAHQSGLPDLELYEELIGRDSTHVVTGADVIPALASWKPGLGFTPGAKFRYCNTNYVVLAQLVEAVSGEPFANYLDEHVFKPAGMRSTYSLSNLPSGKAVKAHVLPAMFVTQYVDVMSVSLADTRVMRRYRYELSNLGATSGDQNIFSTVGDLQKFDRALREGKLLSNDTQALAYSPATLNDGTTPTSTEPSVAYGTNCSYGLGWDVCNHPELGMIVGHSGYNRGIKTLLYREIKSGRTVAMYDNANGNQFDDKAASILNVLNGKPPAKIEWRKSATRAYGEALLRDGPATALILYNRLRLDTAAYAESPEGMNLLGYDLLRNGHRDLALEAFRINLIRYPGDYNAYDSFGEALANLGRREDAIRMYERAVELEPKAVDSIQALKALRER